MTPFRLPTANYAPPDAPAPAAAPAVAPAAVAPPVVGDQPAPKMPDGLDPKFWDAQSGKVDESGLIKSYGELSKTAAEHAEKAKAIPAEAKLYKAELPADFVKALPPDVKFNFDDKDPVRGPILSEARTVAHELGVDQVGFSKLLALQAKLEMSNAAAADAAAAEAIKAETAKLGDKGPARVAAVESYLKANFTSEQYEAARPFANTAASFEFIEGLIAKANATAVPGTKTDPPAPKASDVPIAERWYAPQKVG